MINRWFNLAPIRAFIFLDADRGIEVEKLSDKKQYDEDLPGNRTTDGARFHFPRPDRNRNERLTLSYPLFFLCDPL